MQGTARSAIIMNMKKIIIIGAVGLAIVAGLLLWTGVLKVNVDVSPSGGTTNAAVPEGWTTYTSGEFGYTVAYPEGWNMQEGGSGGSRDVFISAPKNAAFVRIAGFVDSSINSAAAVENSIAQYKASFADKPSEQLNEFTSEMQGEIGGFAASGRMAAGEALYQFLERGLLAVNGRVLIMRGGVLTDKTALTQEEFDGYAKDIKTIMNSFGVK